MSFPRTKTRTLIVAGTPYHWLVGPNDGYNLFVAEKAGSNGRRLEVYVDPYTGAAPNAAPTLLIIKPREAALLIQQALQLGWHPAERGRPVVFDWRPAGLIPRQPPG